MTTDSGRIELPTGVRVIRRLMPPDAPWPATLVRTEDGGARMLVDQGLLTEWDGWDARTDGHVLGPLDVLRRADGHDVMLPLCTERVITLLSRRGATLPLTPGESVTLAVSVLRGLVEVGGREADAHGSWWLTDEGCPVFVDEPGGPAAVPTSAELLDQLAVGVPDRLIGALAVAAAAAREPRVLAREIDDVEELLFAVADAEPLATAPLASLRRRSAPPTDARATEPEDHSRSWAATLLGSVDTDLADAVSRATTGLWRRMRRPVRRGGRRPWALAGCLGAGVIAVGLLWPSPGGPAAAGEAVSSPSASIAVETAAPTDDPPEPQAPAESSTGSPGAGEGPPDLVAETSTLLDARRECVAAGGGACLAEVMEDPERPVPAGPVDAPADQRTLTLLDEFGGVAVLRAEMTNSRGTSAQLVTVSAGDDGRWLLRDVHDVAAQP